MASKKTAAQLRAENQALKRFRASQGFISVLNNLIKWGALVVIAWLMSETIGTLAGKTTIAEIGIGFLADVRISEAVAWIFGVSGTAYGLGQRKLRRKGIARLEERATRNEKKIDPGRSSSRLTPTGETREEDL